jgi:hypothetical protein
MQARVCSLVGVALRVDIEAVVVAATGAGWAEA